MLLKAFLRLSACSFCGGVCSACLLTYRIFGAWLPVFCQANTSVIFVCYLWIMRSSSGEWFRTGRPTNVPFLARQFRTHQERTQPTVHAVEQALSTRRSKRRMKLIAQPTVGLRCRGFYLQVPYITSFSPDRGDAVEQSGESYVTQE